MNPDKPKLLVILGAGSSIPCGMPGVGDIDLKMKEWSREWKPANGVSGGPNGGVFNALWKTVEAYYQPYPHYGIRANFEKVLGEMTSLANWVAPSPFGNVIREAVQNGTLADIFAPSPPEAEPNLYRKLIVEQQSFLLGKLAAYMRERSRALDTGSTAFEDYRGLFLRLREQFDLGIYNLNYDTVARSAWPEAFNGFSNGVFDPARVSLRRDWKFIYHLHGSVHHSIAGPYDPSLIWKDDLAGSFDDYRILSPDMAQEFRPIALTTLIAGGFKLDQLLADPYQTFYAALIRHAHEADAILIAGYGFGDLHINRVLRNRFERPDDDVAYPPVVILTRSDLTALQTGSRQSHDFWAYQLRHTLGTAFETTREHLERKLTVAEFIQTHGFETDVLGRVAIWHGGFIEALGSFGELAERLERE